MGSRVEGVCGVPYFYRGRKAVFYLGLRAYS